MCTFSPLVQRRRARGTVCTPRRRVPENVALGRERQARATFAVYIRGYPPLVARQGARATFSGPPPQTGPSLIGRCSNGPGTKPQAETATRSTAAIASRNRAA